MSEQTAKFAQRIGEVVLKTVELATAMYRLQNEATQESSKETEAKPSPKPKKRKTSKNSPVVAPNQAGPSQVATPPAKKQYKGTTPLCNKCNGHHQAHLQCRLCVSCGRVGHLASACRSNPNQGGPNKPQANPAQAHFPPGSCYNCGKMGHFMNKCPKLANANPTHG
ncbi:zinc finger CCHC domain-containing protein 7-like [Helianthus annuus]|uniref:zinc finger CCHC domain-containing protein 7-like n=1 Tax=Helianthus annuus TaxID=4232 RepID=UPI000B8FF66B|nr:zinc finger CCHC domain-containing protein 7-like [Helianthus annuus]